MVFDRMIKSGNVIWEDLTRCDVDALVLFPSRLFEVGAFAPHDDQDPNHRRRGVRNLDSDIGSDFYSAMAFFFQSPIGPYPNRSADSSLIRIPRERTSPFNWWVWSPWLLVAFCHRFSLLLQRQTAGVAQA